MLLLIKRIAQKIKNFFIQFFTPKKKAAPKSNRQRTQPANFSSAASIRSSLPPTTPTNNPELDSASTSESDSSLSIVSIQTDVADKKAHFARIEQACRNLDNAYLNSLTFIPSANDTDKDYAVDFITDIVRVNFNTLYRHADTIVSITKSLTHVDSRYAYDLQDTAEKMRRAIRELGVTIVNRHSFGDYFIGGFCNKITEHRAATDEIKLIVAEMQKIFSASEKLFKLDIICKHEVTSIIKTENILKTENANADERAQRLAGL